MRKRDGIGGLAAPLVLIAMIALVMALLAFGVMAATNYLPRH
ncbi:hypothetical protein [Amycolatopsis coloradensis]|nr:hypothetical protein [Amycolatopsis coloradensis]